jgi:hypothetical protein
MARKTLQKDSQYNHLDLDNNGTITDKEILLAERKEELAHRKEMHLNLDKMQDQQRMMAWVAMGSMVVFVVAMMTPIIDITRVKELSGFLNTFFVSQAAVVSVFMGATAYSKRNNDISVQAKGN